MKGSDLKPFFSEQFFIPALKATSKKGILKELVRPLVTAQRIKNERVILTTLLQREKLGSTGIGKGVAIPHCRTLAVSDVQIIVGHSNEGIPFESGDGQDVYLFFLIVAPPMEEDSQYLPILGALCELLKKSKTRNALFEAKTFEQFIKIIGSK